MNNLTEKLPVSVLIPTLDEERNIADCLASVDWADEVIMIDSHSTDRTLDIAREHGAKVVQRRFRGHADQKNWALDNIPMRHPWILILDADERITEPLKAEIETAIDRDEGPDCYYIARKIIMYGRWLRHGGRYPDFNLRLFRAGKARYEDRLTNEHMIPGGPTGYFRNPLLHHDEKGVDRYFARQNRYSTMEAVDIHLFLTRKATDILPGDWRKRGPQRTRALKHFAYRWLPFRPLAAFIYMYIFKRGFLDGRAGWIFCVSRAFYEFQISLKLRELEDPDSPLSRQYAKRLGLVDQADDS